MVAGEAAVQLISEGGGGGGGEGGVGEPALRELQQLSLELPLSRF